LTLEDVKNPRIAVAVCRTYLIHYGKKLEKREGRKSTYQDYARMWNGGPLGYKKEPTEKYWEKVSPHLTHKVKRNIYIKVVNGGY